MELLLFCGSAAIKPSRIFATCCFAGLDQIRCEDTSFVFVVMTCTSIFPFVVVVGTWLHNWRGFLQSFNACNDTRSAGYSGRFGVRFHSSTAGRIFTMHQLGDQLAFPVSLGTHTSVLVESKLLPSLNLQPLHLNDQYIGRNVATTLVAGIVPAIWDCGGELD